MALYNIANTDAYNGGKYLHKKDKEIGLEAEILVKKIQQWQ